MRSKAALIFSEMKRGHPPLATEHLGASHLCLVDAHVTHGGILADHIREPAFMSPEPDPGRCFVDTSDEACSHEGEVLIRLALYVHGDQLHIIRGRLREHGRDSDMEHRDVEARLRVVQRRASVANASESWASLLSSLALHRRSS
jgi:hypothetical protein